MVSWATHPISPSDHSTVPSLLREREYPPLTRGAANKVFSAQADQALQLYYAQLALNMLWTPIFFGGESSASGT